MLSQEVSFDMGFRMVRAFIVSLEKDEIENVARMLISLWLSPRLPSIR